MILTKIYGATCKNFSLFNSLEHSGCTTYVRFQVVTVASMKMIAFWDTASCSLIKVDRRFRGALMMEAVRISKTSVYFNEASRVAQSV
jgi:hypothetical protein